ASLTDLRSQKASHVRQFLRDGYRTLGDKSVGLLPLFPADVLWAWVDKNMEERAYWLGRAMPKTLDNYSARRLTRDFIARYGNFESVQEAVAGNFAWRIYSGKESDYARHLRDEARSWLEAETDATVIRWIENYIASLGRDIERAEIDE